MEILLEKKKEYESSPIGFVAIMEVEIVQVHQA
jgi:hypothetical protein